MSMPLFTYGVMWNTTRRKKKVVEKGKRKEKIRSYELYIHFLYCLPPLIRVKLVCIQREAERIKKNARIV